MLYALICTDNAHAGDIREKTRDEHRAFLEGLGNRLKAAGPFQDDFGHDTGSLIIIEASNRDEALMVAEEDPYSRAGLFTSVEIRPWRWRIGNPER